jgi:cytochrome c biogenesis protein CcmG/thiol:disulfide interchange protein DsbE
MDRDRAVNIAKWAVLIGVVPVVLAVLMPRADNPPGNVKPAAMRKAMPDFSLHDLGGADWKLSSHRGGVVLVNFWATWCGPCQEETPGLIRIAHRYGSKGLSVAGISMDEGGTAPVRKFLKDFGVDYPVMMPDSKFLLANEIENLPTTFLIDRQGRIAKTYVGGVREAVFRADIERLLGEPVT